MHYQNTLLPYLVIAISVCAHVCAITRKWCRNSKKKGKYEHLMCCYATVLHLS